MYRQSIIVCDAITANSLQPLNILCAVVRFASSLCVSKTNVIYCTRYSNTNLPEAGNFQVAALDMLGLIFGWNKLGAGEMLAVSK